MTGLCTQPTSTTTLNCPPNVQGSREQFKAGIGMFLSAFPDWGVTIDASIAEGDMVAIRWSFQGTHTAEFASVPATNKRISWGAVSFHRMADGMLAESWVNYDAMGMMQQLGVVPMPG